MPTSIFVAPKSLSWLELAYSLKDKRPGVNSEGETTYRYRCPKYRSTTCKASLSLFVKLNDEGKLLAEPRIHLSQDHTTCQDEEKLSKRSRQDIKIIDLREAMKLRVEELVIAEPTLGARTVATRVMQEIKDEHKGEAFEFLTIDQMRSQVYEYKKLEYGNWNGIIKHSKLYYCSDDDERPFLQFHFGFPLDGVWREMLGWGHPDLIFLLKSGDHHIFIDCTFSVCPKGFYQLLIFMIYDEATELYIPIFYVLLPSKHYLCYYHALHNIICATDWKANCRSWTCDFEKALIAAVKEQFGLKRDGVTPSESIGCYFHWKQCLRRRLLELHIDKDLISKLMDKDGLINLLPLVPIDDVSRAIRFIRSIFPEGDSKPKFDKFWHYFEKVWMKDYDPILWNISAMTAGGLVVPDDMINRTNNALERYNREMNKAFPTAHPTMIEFVTVIRTEALRILKLYEDIKRGRQQKPTHRPVTLWPIPDAYRTFV